LDAEEHVVQAEAAPVLEHLLVLDEDVRARLEVVLLANAAALDLAADREAVLGMDERDVVDEEHVRLGDPGEGFDGGLRRRLAVAPAVEGPRAAERAVPGAPPRELGGGAGIQHADEVLVAAAAEVPRGREAIEVVQQGRARPGAVPGHDTGQALELWIADGLE